MEIKPIESHAVRNGFVCDTLLVRILEKQYREAIEALEELTIEGMNNYDNERNIMICRQTSKQLYSDEIAIIEKAYGESWDDIRREK